MKTKSPLFLMLLGLVIFLLNTCHPDPFCRQADGTIVTKTISIADFTGIELKLHATVYLKQGSPQKVSVRAPEDLIRNIETNVRADVWEIQLEECMNYYNEVTIFITVPEIVEVNNLSSGDILFDGLFKNITELDVANLGSGNIFADVEAMRINSKILGSGDLELHGLAATHDVSVSGSGNLLAFDLVTSLTKVKVTGSGDAEVYPVDFLEVMISGSGDVYFIGDPAIDLVITGSGNLYDAN